MVLETTHMHFSGIYKASNVGQRHVDVGINSASVIEPHRQQTALISDALEIVDLAPTVVQLVRYKYGHCHVRSL